MRSVSALATATLASCLLLAHQIPNDITVRAIVKPAADRLTVLVRVPVEALRDLSWPTKGPGYLDLRAAEAFLHDAAALWVLSNIKLFENGETLPAPVIVAVRVSLPADRSFDSYEDAMALVTGPRLKEDTQLHWEQAMLDVLMEYQIGSDRSQFSIQPTFARLGLRVTSVFQFLPPGRSGRTFEWFGDPGLISLDPRWYQAALHFLALGFFHILGGLDHVLFLLCLVAPLTRFRSLLVVVTSFTLAHSITLVASALGAVPSNLWFPPLIEVLIAFSIVYMALENIVGSNFERRWIFAFVFGLVHGFGFSFALRGTLQFAGGHLFVSLFAFNMGVEFGQIILVAILSPTLYLFYRFAVTARMGTIILSILVAHTAWHWMVERGSDLSRYSWPGLSYSTAASTLRWLAAGVVIGGLLWLIALLFQNRLGQNESVETEHEWPSKESGP